jgi:hypothetical protein
MNLSLLDDEDEERGESSSTPFGRFLGFLRLGIVATLRG